MSNKQFPNAIKQETNVHWTLNDADEPADDDDDEIHDHHVGDVWCCMSYQRVRQNERLGAGAAERKNYIYKQ